eukprot:3939080-Rhodomonas_salina.2
MSPKVRASRHRMTSSLRTASAILRPKRSTKSRHGVSPRIVNAPSMPQGREGASGSGSGARSRGQQIEKPSGTTEDPKSPTPSLPFAPVRGCALGVPIASGTPAVETRSSASVLDAALLRSAQTVRESSLLVVLVLLLLPTSCP